MARLFGIAGDKISLGSPTALDNLIQSGQLMMVCECRRNTNTAQIMLASKAAVNAGFVWDVLGTGANLGKMLFAVERATQDTQVIGNTAMPDNTHVCVGVNWDASQGSGTNGVTFYANIIELPLTAMAATTGLAGSGAINADAAADMLIGNYAVSDLPWKGDLGWFVLKHKAGTTPWTQYEFRQVQAGILACKAAREAGGSIARGLAMINASGAAEVILEIKADGTVTDHSANALTATRTGTAAGTEQTGWFAPTAFEDDLEPEHPTDKTEQVLYRYTSEFARKSFVTTATGFTAWAHSTAALFADDRVTQIPYLIDGVYTDEIRSALTTQYMVDQRSGLSGSSKTITFMNGMRATADGVRPYLNTSLVLVRFNAAATEQAPATRAAPLVVIGDSHLEGFYVDNSGQEGCIQKLRLNLPSMYDSVIMYGAGGLELHDVGADATARQVLADLLCAPAPTAILSNLAGNDWFTGDWGPVSNYSAALSDFIDKLLAGFSGHVYIAGIVANFPDGSPYEGLNSQGESSQDYRDAIAAVCATKGSRVSYLPLDNVVDEGNFDVDLSHPNVAGHDQLFDYFVVEVTKVSITAQDAAHAHLADSPALTQANVLAAADALHAHPVDSPALTQANTLVTQDALHAHTASAPTLVQDAMLAAADSSSAHTADNVDLTQAAVLAVADALHAHTADSPTVVQLYLLATMAAHHAHTADEPDLMATAGPWHTWTAAPRRTTYIAPGR